MSVWASTDETDADGRARRASRPALPDLLGLHGVRPVRLRGPADERTDRATLRRVLRGLRLLPDLDGPVDGGGAVAGNVDGIVAEPAADIPWHGLDAERQRLLAEVAAEPGLLDALSDAATRTIAAQVGALSSESRSALLPLLSRLRQVETRGR